MREAEKELAEFFRVQGIALASKWPDPKSRKGLADMFNLGRWNSVLTPIVDTIALAVSAVAGRSILSALGLDAGEYDEDRTRAWLAEHAAGVASGINGVTRIAVRDALAAGSTAGEVRDLFEVFATGRAPQIAQTEVTAATGFGVREAAQQSGLEMAKTWQTGSNPRTSHARLDGETRPMNDLFSNGARWPGDSILDDKERAGCNCSMRVETA